MDKVDLFTVVRTHLVQPLDEHSCRDLTFRKIPVPISPSLQRVPLDSVELV